MSSAPCVFPTAARDAERLARSQAPDCPEQLTLSGIKHCGVRSRAWRSCGGSRLTPRVHWLRTQVPSNLLGQGALPTMIAHRHLAPLTLFLAVFATSASASRSMLEPVAPKDPLNTLAQARGPINTLAELSQALRRCWRWPPANETTPGMQFTMQVSFKSNGELFGDRIIYQSQDISDKERALYADAMHQALKRCSPLSVSTSLGEAIAGRPMIIEIHDTQQQRHDDQPVTPSRPR